MGALLSTKGRRSWPSPRFDSQRLTMQPLWPIWRARRLWTHLRRPPRTTQMTWRSMLQALTGWRNKAPRSSTRTLRHLLSSTAGLSWATPSSERLRKSSRCASRAHLRSSCGAFMCGASGMGAVLQLRSWRQRSAWRASAGRKPFGLGCGRRTLGHVHSTPSAGSRLWAITCFSSARMSRQTLSWPSRSERVFICPPLSRSRRTSAS
eukprot:Amastigsp_a25_472.p3 type:complete len:207 gc:universal Amastigsp_a25_472:1-621(+)